jgi:hypothetical protein
MLVRPLATSPGPLNRCNSPWSCMIMCVFIQVEDILSLTFNVHGSMHHNNILIYIQQDATLHSLFHLQTALHVSGVTSTHCQEHKQLYLQHLVFVTLLLLPAAIVAGSSNSVTNTRCCRYGCLCSWRWVEVPPKTCRAVCRWNKLCNVASCWIYITVGHLEHLSVKLCLDKQ